MLDIGLFLMLAAGAYATWWVISMTDLRQEPHRCPYCRTRQAWYKTGRTREMSHDPTYQGSHLWTIIQSEYRCNVCHYTSWSPPATAKRNDDNLVA